ncbi:MAG: GAF domain-containing protein [Acidiferrobacterales bacterium]|nr:GAF domain-containing protein [Acidiferrobacterales bacterium]
MSEHLLVANGDRQQRYQALLPQIESLLCSESDWLANLSNVAAALHQTFAFLWVGFYRVDAEELVLGPFQGPIACTRIKKGKGVCGKAWQLEKTILVPDVDNFAGHIACSSASKSEIVVPIWGASSNIEFILDVDSDQLNDFSELDKTYLEKVAALITANLKANTG